RRSTFALLALLLVAAACAPDKEPPPGPPPPPPLGFPCSSSPGTPAPGNDPLRTGWYPDEPGLHPSDTGCAFGEMWSNQVDGQVYAQPVVDEGAGPSGQNVLVVATERNKIYGFNSVSGQKLWDGPSNLGPPWNPNDLNPPCTDLAPWVGIT